MMTEAHHDDMKGDDDDDDDDDVLVDDEGYRVLVILAEYLITIDLTFWYFSS